MGYLLESIQNCKPRLKVNSEAEVVGDRIESDGERIASFAGGLAFVVVEASLCVP